MDITVERITIETQPIDRGNFQIIASADVVVDDITIRGIALTYGAKYGPGVIPPKPPRGAVRSVTWPYRSRFTDSLTKALLGRFAAAGGKLPNEPEILTPAEICRMLTKEEPSDGTEPS